MFDPDLIDWYGGLGFNRGEYARSRGVAASASEEFEYEESLQFATNDTLAAFGPSFFALYMCVWCVFCDFVSYSH